MGKPQFVTISLNGMQRERYSDLCSHVEDWPITATDMVQIGYKISITPQASGEGCYVALTDKREKSENKGVILGCFGATIGACFRDLEIAVGLAIEHQIKWSEVKDVLQKEANQDVQDYAEFMEWKRSQTNVKASSGDDK